MAPKNTKKRNLPFLLMILATLLIILGINLGEVSAVVTQNCFKELEKPVKRLTGMRTGIPYDKDLERQVVPGVKDIEEAVRTLLE